MVFSSGSLAVLLLTPFDAAVFNSKETSCLSTSYYGTYKGQSLFVPPPDCLTTTSDFLKAGTLVPATKNFEASQLLWVEEVAVEEVVRNGELAFGEELDAFLAKQTIQLSDNTQQAMRVSAQPQSTFELLHREDKAALLALSPDAARELTVNPPRLWKLLPVPSTPMPYVPVPEDALKPVKKLLDNLKFDPVISALVETISVPQMRADVRYLTGEQEGSPIWSRHSFSEGSRTAAKWIKETIEGTGATCELKQFLIGFAPNVICRYPATTPTTETVLISAHYDSRGSFGNNRAPGGDDDGSGTMAILAIARAIWKSGITFRKNVELVTFAGEEQGLYGSKAYARELRENNANISVMIQADMLAYHVDDEPAQLGLPQYIGTPEVTQLVANLSALYSPELKVGYTAACCSDHQSFHEQGFPASQVFERAGPIADPFYHNSRDLSERPNYDFEQVKSIAKIQFATLLLAGDFELPA